jgi:sugar transferase EpsL
MRGLPIRKRILDLILVALATPVWIPLLLVIAGGLRVIQGQPVLFVQKRPGLAGRPFNLLKFRTMRHGTGPDAERLTRMGRFLRAASLDELPELLNVIRGDMSLVGPRPLLMRYLGRYTPRQARRHEVLPGMTGWAQVNGRNLLSWEAKFNYDVWYVDNWSLLLDLRILVRTIGQVARRRGIAHGSSATMPEYLGPDQEGETRKE